MIRVIITAITLALSGLSQASSLLSDDFNTATLEANPVWQFYDPLDITGINDPGQTTLSYNGTDASISIPAASSHNLALPPENRAPRLLQPSLNEDFQIEVKFDTIPITPTQSQGIVVEQSHNVFLRFDIYYGANEFFNVYAAYINGDANAITTHRSSPLSTRQVYPKYHRVTRAGNQWTYAYSVNGTTWTTAVSFTRSMTVTAVGTFASTSGANPAFLSNVDYFMNRDPETALVDNDVWIAPAPLINTWYGYAPPLGQFGLPGVSQQWANIQGNVFSHAGLSALTYQLNDGAEQALAFGSDTRRLPRQGDFNIELDYAGLLAGANSIVIRATDTNGRITTRPVTLNYAPGNQWPLPYTANWQSTDIQSIENVAHIVDGSWMLTPSGIRTKQPGYDRIINLGDINWSTDNMAVTVPVTAHGNFTGLGFGLGWQGHGGNRRPRVTWPLQALAWIRGPITNPSVGIVTYEPEPSGGPGIENRLVSQPVSVVANTTYLLKAYSEPLGNGLSRFYVKFWPQSASEPANWNVQADIPPRNGSVILVAYNGDVTFGNVSIGPLSGGGGDNTAPVIGNVQSSSVTNNGATITWTTNEAASSSLNYGLTDGYGSNSTNAALTSSHSITLTGLSPSTTYHYRVNSTDASNNTASSGDFSFTTSAASASSPSGLVSDGFNTGTLDPRWIFYDPLANSTRSMTGTQAAISVIAGSAHNLWTGALNAARIRQAVTNNTDFEVEVKFDSAVTAQYQMQGITVEQNNTNLLRFDFYYDGSTVRTYSASINNGTATQRFSRPIASGSPLYLRVTRAGSQWTMSYSYNGTSWTVAGTYTYALSVTQVGVFAGNNGSPAPAHTALVDYFTAR